MGMYYYGIKTIDGTKIAVRLGGSHYTGVNYIEDIDRFRDFGSDIERHGMLPYECESITEKKIDDIMINDIYNLLRVAELCRDAVSILTDNVQAYAIYRMLGEFEEYYESSELSEKYPNILRLGG